MYTSVTLKEYLKGVQLEIPGYGTQKKVRPDDRTFCGDSRSRTDDPLLAKQVLQPTELYPHAGSPEQT